MGHGGLLCIYIQQPTSHLTEYLFKECIGQKCKTRKLRKDVGEGARKGRGKEDWEKWE